MKSNKTIGSTRYNVKDMKDEARSRQKKVETNLESNSDASLILVSVNHEISGFTLMVMPIVKKTNVPIIIGIAVNTVVCLKVR